jgi:zinc and cadmium transporter
MALVWSLIFGLLMAAVALVGSLVVLLRKETLDRLLVPLVASAAGSLVGGAFFHLLPESLERMGNTLAVFAWLAAGFVVFFCIEQFLHWHHCHRATHDHDEPLIWLILIADGLHNLLGGLSIGAMFAAEFRLGITGWLAAAAHELPQELGDFGILVYGGLSRRRALLYNLLCALTFPAGMLIAHGVSAELDLTFLVPFGAGNFLYIAAADLIPEVKRPATFGRAVEHLLCFLSGLLLLLALRLVWHGASPH